MVLGTLSKRGREGGYRGEREDEWERGRKGERKRGEGKK